MMSRQKKPSRFERVTAYIGPAGGLVGIIGGILGIVGYFHSLQVETRTEHRLCIADLSSYPKLIRPTAQEVTDSVLKWVVTPDLPHQSSAKKATINLQIQIQAMSAQLEKYASSEPSVESFSRVIESLIVAIKNNDSEGAPIDAYAIALDKLISAPKFSQRCK